MVETLQRLEQIWEARLELTKAHSVLPPLSHFFGKLAQVNYKTRELTNLNNWFIQKKNKTSLLLNLRQEPVIRSHSGVKKFVRPGFIKPDFLPPLSNSLSTFYRVVFIEFNYIISIWSRKPGARPQVWFRWETGFTVPRVSFWQRLLTWTVGFIIRVKVRSLNCENFFWFLYWF